MRTGATIAIVLASAASAAHAQGAALRFCGHGTGDISYADGRPRAPGDGDRCPDRQARVRRTRTSP